ncbi:hypothetical protein [Acinetobacter gerneri]|uniref:Uncharacterized protein n=1 Tax=Acinetobacter gerneri DSM 14967 = CIP 107464 = MTCC 9824 TaxID=1120926 RepID=N8ZP20_9GAMM|nr:hypothetical protein [Acinetobacter gerneri]ENV35484.1 hypothetical protein F960_00291 [Acinetobacter gerneri DSM 14967 = CIP 107464 = MTCC 9824]EPR82501.1 hypothetical protein L289_2995 [Acinetobacter gerneri DSM 14967 = CIP 107464 = MTCC 9824]
MNDKTYDQDNQPQGFENTSFGEVKPAEQVFKSAGAKVTRATKETVTFNIERAAGSRQTAAQKVTEMKGKIEAQSQEEKRAQARENVQKMRERHARERDNERGR